ncbi:TrmB family transcriptional regulator [Haladaptatus sp. W1]|uniref:TrmB family transcriptional regulator n=1 Tax=Haladaptatus sp. W1 TaxID=1897478 RepID=UPI0008499901|nr:TrmB family transcriptional regulator [Haladaptatus sp. W1]ODR79953.1 TrmB family transcriptional regulator [Haladaptatus sp. W1]
MDEVDAIDALTDLGLSNYEAKVFVALQKLGTGTARDIHGVTDVPRSQVYGAAEDLQEHGLVEVKQSKPIQYRPVSLEAAKSLLRDQFERTQERAFDYLESAKNEFVDSDEEREDVWSVDGKDAVSSRICQLVAEAESRIVFGLHDESLVTEKLTEILRERATAGVDVLVVSQDPSLRDRFDGLRFVVRHDKPEGAPAGRILIADDDTVLISILGERESAIWSSQTGFAELLCQTVSSHIDDIIVE